MNPTKIVFQFADDDLENIYSIMIRQQKTEEDPIFLKKLKEIKTLRLEVEIQIVPLPPEEMKLMSNLLNICGIVIASSQYPDATLQQFYRQYYHCKIKAEQIKAEVQSPSDLSMFFPYQDTWWPVFTIDQISSESFQKFIHNGIRPGIIFARQRIFGFPHYFLLKAIIRCYSYCAF